MPYISLLLIALAVGADRVLKLLVVEFLKPDKVVTVIPGLFDLVYLENKGAALGSFSGMRWLLIGVTGICCVLLLLLLFRYTKHDFWSKAACVLVIAGGIGNLVDRILLGYVVDYIRISFFPPIFNFADCCVTVGVVLAIVHVFITEPRRGKKHECHEISDSSGK